MGPSPWAELFQVSRCPFDRGRARGETSSVEVPARSSRHPVRLVDPVRPRLEPDEEGIRGREVAFPEAAYHLGKPPRQGKPPWVAARKVVGEPRQQDTPGDERLLGRGDGR